ncbi:MAG TPA: DEAD/DEAH box helicase [Gammaproteobacteria bacterium]|nr:DEAD/DEAH box helicase [Gammaproteobacteria bacterium]
MSFSSLGLSAELLRAVSDRGYAEPTPVQSRAIPVVLAGRDLQAAAQTGTGKTAGFTLPLLQRLQKNPQHSRAPRVLVLTPTRELAAQVHESVQTYGKYLPFTATVIFGGVNINPQIEKLRHGADIVVATPGRLLDHAQQKTIDLAHVEILVLDEADRMLDMGFIRDIRRILALLPKQRQNLLFSATFSEDIRKLAAGLLHNPEIIDVAPRNSTAERVSQCVYLCERGVKRALLAWLIGSGNWRQVLIFTRTKHGANRLCAQLQQDSIEAAAIHGNKSQGARTRALAEFKQGRVRALVATDIAARGLDIDQLPHVVNYELPNVPEDYVHRIGRTARAGRAGEAISLVSPDERAFLKDIERLLKQELPRATAEGFRPNPAVLKPDPDNRPVHREHRPQPAHKQESGWHSRSGARGHGQRSAQRRNAGRAR